MAAVRTLMGSITQARVPFITALGVGAHLERWGVTTSRIVELDWWETTQVGPLTIAAGSARHFSGRGLTGGNHTLWASWSIIGPTHRVFHSGDTGPFDGIAENGRRYGPFDIALIKIGAYGPTWPDIHLTPEQAVRACTLVQREVAAADSLGNVQSGVPRVGRARGARRRGGGSGGSAAGDAEAGRVGRAVVAAIRRALVARGREALTLGIASVPIEGSLPGTARFLDSARSALRSE